MDTTTARDEVHRKLTSIFHNVFDDSTITLRDTMTAKDLAQWDSLNHINLIVATEQSFGVKFKTAEIAGLSNVGEFIDAILKKLPARG
jgi:acyl carrier protein